MIPLNRLGSGSYPGLSAQFSGDGFADMRFIVDGASVCLALFVAFWLELDNPFWAGTSAAIVCYPRLGASLRKGWFRMIGTVMVRR
jgi:hypothetical protein